jgi:hypothetical protein
VAPVEPVPPPPPPPPTPPDKSTQIVSLSSVIAVYKIPFKVLNHLSPAAGLLGAVIPSEKFSDFILAIKSV